MLREPKHVIRFWSLVMTLAAACACSLLGRATPTVTAPTIQPPTPVSERVEDATPVPAETEDSPPEFAAAMRSSFVDDVADSTAWVRYQMTLTLTDNPLHIEGEQEIAYTNNVGEELEEIVFRLYPNALSNRTILVVSRVQVDGRSVPTQLEGQNSVLRVELERPLPPGETVILNLDFTFDLPSDVEVGYGRISDIGGIVSAPSFFPLLSIYENGAWWTTLPVEQGDPGYTESALYTVTMTAPSYLTIATSGTTLQETPHPNGTTTYQIVTGPMRDFALAYSRDFDLLSQTRDGLTVNVWTAVADRESQEYVLETAFATVAIFDEQFGTYPFAELDLVEAPVSALGIEYPGLVYLADRIWAAGDPIFEWVIVHEIAHQWWYSLVGNNQVAEPWLDEGLAEYSVEVYYYERVGPRAGNRIRDRYAGEVENYLAEESNDRKPIGLPASEYDSREYRVFVYSGGALVYGELSNQVGRVATLAYLQTYYNLYRYGVAHNEDVLALVEQMLGPEAGDVFQEWVVGE